MRKNIAVTEEDLKKLTDCISHVEGVFSVGISGGKTCFYENGGDIDVFIYCDRIPDSEHRYKVVEALGENVENFMSGIPEGGHWGTADCFLFNGIETWLMYFEIDRAAKEIDSILEGEYPDKVDNYFYPVGRCAMFLKMAVLLDKNGFLADLKNKLSVYPEELSKSITDYHLRELDDIEDLERAVSAKDVLFYHFAIENAMDHFLQALFAINKNYFPSRKRNAEYITVFKYKPVNCTERLLDVIKTGNVAGTLDASLALWKDLTAELKKCAPWLGDER